MLLLIPGPVTTRPEVRAAMVQDMAPWDAGFRPLYLNVQQRVLRLAGAHQGVQVALPLQGSGHFAIEAAIRSLVPAGGTLLIADTGSYAQRMARLARESGRLVIDLPTAPGEPVTPEAVAAALARHPQAGHVGIVYSETSSGVVHDADAIGRAVQAAGRRMILDAVSAFGALPFDISARPETDAVVFTANKCLEGLPGISFVVAQAAALRAARGSAGSWTLDLCDILDAAEREGWGSFRFTPPAQVFAALRTALVLHEAEGGQPARLARYRANAAALYHGLLGIGLQPYLEEPAQGPIVLNCHAPGEGWSLPGFVAGLKQRGFVISNFYNTARPSFRVGCIGAIDADDMRRFVRAADSTLHAMGVRRRAPAPASIGGDLGRRPVLTLDITMRRPRHDTHVVAAADFGSALRGAAVQPVRPVSVLPYAVDDAADRLLYTAHRDLAHTLAAPFLYQAQYLTADHLVSVPLERLAAFEPPMPMTPSFVLSVSRCGTTLLSSLLRALHRPVAAEPDVYTQLVTLPQEWRVRLGRAGQIELIRATTTALAREIGATVVIKLRDHCNEIATLLHEAVPQARMVFMLRDRRDWARSRHGAFSDPPQALADLLCRGVTTFDTLARGGHAPVLIWYEDLVSQPLPTLRRLGVPPQVIEAAGPDAVAATLSRDAQAGTSIGRDGMAGRGLSEAAMEEFERIWAAVAPRDLLRRHGMDRLLPAA